MKRKVTHSLQHTRKDIAEIKRKYESARERYEGARRICPRIRLYTT